MIALDTPLLARLSHTTSADVGHRGSSPFSASNLTAPDGEDLAALLCELCTEGSLPREQLDSMVEAARRISSLAPRRPA